MRARRRLLPRSFFCDALQTKRYATIMPLGWIPIGFTRVKFYGRARMTKIRRSESRKRPLDLWKHY